MARDKFGGPPPMAPQMNVDLSKAEDVVCEKCGNYTFEQVMLMKRMSAIVSPTGKEAIVPIPTFALHANVGIGTIASLPVGDTSAEIRFINITCSKV